jgi:hypothetical protein
MIRAWTVPHNSRTNGTRKLLNIGVEQNASEQEEQILLTTDIKPGIDF